MHNSSYVHEALILVWVAQVEVQICMTFNYTQERHESVVYFLLIFLAIILQRF